MMSTSEHVKLETSQSTDDQSHSNELTRRGLLKMGVIMGAAAYASPALSNSLAGQAIVVFVFRPGGVAQDNVFTDWQALVDAMKTVEGRKILEFDDSVSSPCVIPPLPPGGPPWEMRDVSWAGFGPRPGRARSEVHILEGARFANFRMIGGQITIVNKATTTPPIADFHNLDHVHIGLRDDAGNTELINEGQAPLFHIAANAAVFFLQNCVFGSNVKSVNPLIRYVPEGAPARPLFLNLMGQNQTGNNVVEVSHGAPVVFGALSPAAQVGADQSRIIESGGILRFAPVGRIQRQVLPLPPAAPAPEPLLPNIAEQFFTLPNVVLRCDGRPPGFVQPLPKINGGFTMGDAGAVAVYSGGQEVIVAELEGGPLLKVAPAQDDTIDGVRNAQVKIAPHGSRTFVSDGVNNWITISVVP
jgi:hypothetical protein